jgi:hypothetical protein
MILRTSCAVFVTVVTRVVQSASQCVLAVIIWSGLSVAGNAATASLQESLTIPALATTPNPSEIQIFTNPFNLFNPSLGELNSVDVTLSGTVVFTVAENTGYLYLAVSLCAPKGYPCMDYQATPSLKQGPNTISFILSGSPDEDDLVFFEGTGVTRLRVAFDSHSPEDTLSSDGFTGSITYNYTVSPNFTVSPIPLPAALPLFATGLGIVGFLGWCRRKKQRHSLPD